MYTSTKRLGNAHGVRNEIARQTTIKPPHSLTLGGVRFFQNMEWFT
jgi:hypothetical protein